MKIKMFDLMITLINLNSKIKISKIFKHDRNTFRNKDKFK